MITLAEPAKKKKRDKDQVKAKEKKDKIKEKDSQKSSVSTSLSNDGWVQVIFVKIKNFSGENKTHILSDHFFLGKAVLL